MTTIEIGHRTLSMLKQNVEQVRVSSGWQPVPKKAVKNRKGLFSHVADWQSVCMRCPAFDQIKLSDLANGKIDIYDYHSLDIGRPVNWHQDPLTGQNSPLSFGKKINYRDNNLVGDIKVLWEIGRHQHLIPLAVAYACTGNTFYRDSVIEQLVGWVEANPYGIGIHWSSSLECGIRLLSWAVIHSLIGLRDGDDGLFLHMKDSDRFGRAIYQQAWFIRNNLSLYSSANNHLIGELTALWITNKVFDLGVVGEQWAMFAKQELEVQAAVQTHSDGVNKEQAVYYHLWVLEYLLLLWLVGESHNDSFSRHFKNRILLMSDFLKAISLDFASPPQVGDADDGFVIRFDATWPDNPYGDVQDAIEICMRGQQISALKELRHKPLWYSLIAGPATHPSSEFPLPDKTRLPVLYNEGGYAILGDRNIKLVFDAGPLGYPSIAAHGHADALSFCLAMDNEWWLIDPGTYSYHREAEWRNHFRGTSAHNTVQVDGCNQSDIGGPFLWTRRARATILDSGVRENLGQFVRGTHDGYQTIGVTHHRQVEYEPDSSIIRILDSLTSQKNVLKRANVSIFFHFAPDTEIEIQDSQCLVTRYQRRSFLRLVLDPHYKWTIVKGQKDPIQGWYSPRLGVKLPSPVLIGYKTCQLPEEITTTIEPHSSRLRTKCTTQNPHEKFNQ